jgi:hypothetical protein
MSAQRHRSICHRSCRHWSFETTAGLVGEGAWRAIMLTHEQPAPGSVETALGRGHRRELETVISRQGLSNLGQFDSSRNEGGRCDRRVF